MPFANTRLILKMSKEGLRMDHDHTQRPRDKVESTLAIEWIKQVEKNIAPVLNKNMEAIVPMACRLLGEAEEASSLIKNNQVFDDALRVFALFENIDVLRKATFGEVRRYIDVKEPWEDYDILVFDESFEWYLGFTHNDAVLLFGKPHWTYKTN